MSFLRFMNILIKDFNLEEPNQFELRVNKDMNEQQNVSKENFLEESFNSVEWHYETSNIDAFVPAIKNWDPLPEAVPKNEDKNQKCSRGHSKGSIAVSPNGYFFSTPDCQDEPQSNMESNYNETSAQTPRKKNGFTKIGESPINQSFSRCSSTNDKEYSNHQSSSTEGDSNENTSR